MEIQVKRQATSSEGHGFTHGDMYIDGEWFCYTLEDELRERKIYGETAIPAGKYKVELINSPKFGPNSLWVRNVPNFEGILIHGGVNEKHTAGCILVGTERQEQTIQGFNYVLQPLKDKVIAAYKAGEEVYVVIENMPGDRFVDTQNEVPSA